MLVGTKGESSALLLALKAEERPRKAGGRRAGEGQEHELLDGQEGCAPPPRSWTSDLQHCRVTHLGCSKPLHVQLLVTVASLSPINQLHKRGFTFELSTPVHASIRLLVCPHSAAVTAGALWFSSASLCSFSAFL